MLNPISHLFRCFGSDVGTNHPASASNMPPQPSGQSAVISPALPLPAATTSASDATAPPWQGMTRKSLKAWAYEPGVGVSKRERQDRLKLRRTLLESSKRRDGWLYVRAWLLFNRWVENGEFNSESIDEFSTLMLTRFSGQLS